MLSTAKHFPGHGDTETDSHTNLATIPSDSNLLWSVELQPFIAAIHEGVYLDSVIFQPERVDLYTRHANVIQGSSRCPGWDSPDGGSSAGIYASSNSYGHTGFIGTSIWIDPDGQMLVILLTNAVHPDREW